MAEDDEAREEGGMREDEAGDLETSFHFLKGLDSTLIELSE